MGGAVNTSTAGRDAAGRFTEANPWAARGGQARADALTPDRRREIAAQGFAALVTRRFGGDRAAALAYLGDLGAWASDRGYAAQGLGVFPHPGPMPAKTETPGLGSDLGHITPKG